jgi:hypothetical protein
MDFFVKTEDGFKRKSVTGDEYSFSHRNRDHRFYQFQINGEREILLKINNKGDRIILSSDGYADQFGGPLGKKNETTFVSRKNRKNISFTPR